MGEVPLLAHLLPGFRMPAMLAPDRRELFLQLMAGPLVGIQVRASRGELLWILAPGICAEVPSPGRAARCLLALYLLRRQQ